ncbi:membrane protein [Sediminicola sp. YIK13]|uniref:CCC motif membrane protein n=1 Tax=Sediminicola sp. YIK13 TaxID=1453352 RepID=UPI0007225F59|nr:CCC motif membrane protein [Sediminicola sp. YIK13]ALM07543.1 membrane protein [Sediminicola sp. YIK13]
MEQQKLPNATMIIVLSIASIVLCWCYGLLGLILAVIALILANKSVNLYKTSPELYIDYSTIKTGKVLAIIGLVLNILFILMIVWIIAMVGWDALQDEELMRERMEDIMNQ